MNIIKTAVDFVLDTLYPPKCIFCRSILKKGWVCDKCLATLPYVKGEPMVQKFTYVAKCIAPLYYEDKVRDSILSYKFFGERAYSKYLSVIVGNCIENELDTGDIDVISWVPLSKERLKKRGYNQSELIAVRVAKSLGIPSKPLLKKIKNNTAQSRTTSASQRAVNIKGVYEVIKDVELEGKHILLIDDVVTTGSTLSECARVLRLAGAKRVYCAAIARHRD